MSIRSSIALRLAMLVLFGAIGFGSISVASATWSVHSPGFETHDLGADTYEMAAFAYYDNFGSETVELWRNRQHVKNVENESGITCVDMEISSEQNGEYEFDIEHAGTDFDPIEPDDWRIIEWVQEDYPTEVEFTYDPGNVVWWMVGAGYNGPFLTYCTTSRGDWTIWWEDDTAPNPDDEFTKS